MSESYFLATAVHGRHECYSEDRLTQIFVASFNSSRNIRRAVGKLLSIPEAEAAKLKATSQVHDGAGRIDVVLHSETEEVRRIENKIDAPLTKSQMRRYALNGNGKKMRVVAFVKRYPAEAAVLKEFGVFRWSFLDRLLGIEKLDSTNTDGFVSINFHQHLKDLGMAKVDSISLAELRDLAKALHTLRTKPYPYLSLSRTNFFETATNVFSICQDAIEEARKDPELRERIGTAFRFNPEISYVVNEDDGRKKLTAVLLTARIMLKKPVNDIKSIQAGIAIAIGAQELTKFAIGTWFMDPDWHYTTEIFAKEATHQVKRELQADDFVRFCLKRWRKKLLQHK